MLGGNWFCANIDALGIFQTGSAPPAWKNGRIHGRIGAPLPVPSTCYKHRWRQSGVPRYLPLLASAQQTKLLRTGARVTSRKNCHNNQVVTGVIVEMQTISILAPSIYILQTRLPQDLAQTLFSSTVPGRWYFSPGSEVTPLQACMCCTISRRSGTLGMQRPAGVSRELAV
jgi:hypothetical protein